MEIILGKSAGFCGGIIAAVARTEKELQKNTKIHCLGELTHNKDVMNDLESKGLITINNIEEAENKAIIRAHGVEKCIYEKAKELNIELIDCTCKKVLAIHDLVEEYVNKDYYIILIGKKKHPEIIGTFSFCGNFKSQIETLEDVIPTIESINKSGKSNVLVVAQTTFNSKFFDEIVDALKSKIASNINLEVKKTICDATELRQKETKELANKVDLMIVIGGRHSSNTNKLYDISKDNCKNAILIERSNEIDLDYVKQFNKVGVMAGASTPKKSIDDLIAYLNTVN